jgi:anti-sigma regulatory factor (Ser/Thr protein kinase)/DNA-binding transcriptional ArsR family regulator
MVRVRARGEAIRRFILEKIKEHPSDIGKIASDRFDITRQAINKHLQRLVDEKALTVQGQTRSRVYKLAAMIEWQNTYNLSTARLEEDVIWRNDIGPVLGPQLENVLSIWNYGFSEMFNNAIEHSGGSEIYVHIARTAIDTEIALMDNGVGIFKKIQMAMELLDERHAVLELSKGKLTTDPVHHTGEGIFFASRMFDKFDILSGGVFFTHEFETGEDWILERTKFQSGTAVWMKLNNHTSRTAKKIFDQYASGDDYRFDKTVVPVKLAQYGNEQLISRSQAKRLLARVELFKTVILNFSEVVSIGQAFADEIFRVFATKHPEVQLIPTETNSEVKRMIARAKSGEAKETGKK